MSIRAQQNYIIVNVKSKTVIDLSGTDGVSVIGWEKHGGDNQKWNATQNNNQWVFRNVGTGKYLGLAEGQARNDVNLRGVDNPVDWDVYPDDDNHDHLRIFWPGTSQNVDLADHGNPANGTPVTLWGKWEGTNQQWIFEAA